MRVAGQPEDRFTRARRRLAGKALAPLPLLAAAALVVVGCADSWRLALLAGAAVAALAATRIRFSGRAAVALALVAALLALGGWGPGFEARSPHHRPPQDRGVAHPDGHPKLHREDRS